MNVRLPNALYQAIPLFCVISGFLVVLTTKHPLGIIFAAGLYIYSYAVLWKRVHHTKEES